MPAPAVAASHQVQITDSAFGTAVLTVQVGDTVTWSNVDDRPHTVTSDDGTFDSGNMNEGASFSFTFTEPGTYTYVCAYHDEMRATIVVEAASAPASEAAVPASTPQPQADADAGSTTAHAGDHDNEGEQTDTALPREGRIPALSFLLWGAALIVGGVGLMPSAERPVSANARPTGGWRR
jgi:hypothetical protein